MESLALIYLVGGTWLLTDLIIYFGEKRRKENE